MSILFSMVAMVHNACSVELQLAFRPVVNFQKQRIDALRSVCVDALSPPTRIETVVKQRKDRGNVLQRALCR